MPTADIEKRARSKTDRRGIWPFVLAALFLSLFALHLYPERSTTTRLLLAGNFLLLWAGLRLAAWRSKYCRAAWFLTTAGVAVFLMLPGRDESAGLLRREYVRALLRYEGTPYYWGGETFRGVDCSGLMRCALVDAMLRRCLTTRNPSLVRAGIDLWWHDAGATVMQEGYQGRTHRVLGTDKLNAVDDSQLMPGDMAVLN